MLASHMYCRGTQSSALQEMKTRMKSEQEEGKRLRTQVSTQYNVRYSMAPFVGILYMYK